MKLFEGVRVLDLSRMLAGPYGSMLLADMGAEVIKIEEPDGGDPMRVMGPPFLPDGDSAYFLAINRNKKSVALDLTKPAGRSVFLDLAAKADIVWENFRPGIMERLGLHYAALTAANPGIVMCSISAYGQDGPYRDWPAFDLALQAMGGAMSLTGEEGSRPVRMGLPMGDLAGGMFGAFAVAGALLPPLAHRARGAHRSLAARLPGLAADLHRPVLLRRRACAASARLGPRLGRALRGAGQQRRPPGRGDLRREVLGRVLPRGRAPRVGARSALRVQPRPRGQSRHAHGADRDRRSRSTAPRSG